MQRLSDILARLSVAVQVDGDADVMIGGITSDSRNVRPGMLFVAIPGHAVNGEAFIQDVMTKGATAILTQRAYSGEKVTWISVGNVRLAVAKIAAAFYGGQPQHIVAITGTNGKTSTAEFYRQICQLAGQHSASIGTLGLRSTSASLNARYPSVNTSPDPILMAEMLNELVVNKIDYVALEASSHGLDQFRLDGVYLEAAAFTNLTRDHLDYHVSMEAYFEAKSRLFMDLELSSNAAVINVDDAYGARLAKGCVEKGRRVVEYGACAQHIRLNRVSPNAKGLLLDLAWDGDRHEVLVPVFGAFQAMNLCAAMGLAHESGIAKGQIFAALASLSGVHGRMQYVASHPSGAPMFVDYAHTPDALKVVLEGLRAHTQGRLCVVFGCGGDRDKGKRPQMGDVAIRYADVVFVTDDNPRSENPADIRRQIMDAAPGAREIGDRREAIIQAVKQLSAGDVLVVAGKGHENYQIIGEQTIHFDDAEIIKEALSSL